MRKERIDKYNVKSLLGKGAFGQVWLCVDPGSNKEVAIKEIKKKDLADNEMLERLRVEATLSQKLEHPSIVKCFSSMQSENSFYMVFEYCSGGTLEEYLNQQKTLPLKDALYIMTQLKDAYNYLFSRSIIHRDIKLENILIKHKGELRIKLTDFGCSKIDTTGKTLVGTPKYMAFEIISKLLSHEECKYNYKVDLWALGLCFWELVFGAGNFPFKYSNAKVLLEEVKDYSGAKLRFPLMPKLSKSFYDFFRSILEYRVEKRMSSDEFFNHEIFASDESKQEDPSSEISLKKDLTQTVTPVKSEQALSMSSSDEVFIVKAIFSTLNDLRRYLEKNLEQANTIKILALLLVLSNKGKFKAEATLSLLAQKNKHSNGDKTEIQRQTDEVLKLNEQFLAVDKEIYNIFVKKDPPKELLEKTKENLYSKAPPNQTNFYRDIYMDVVKSVVPLFKGQDKGDFERTLKKVLAILKGEVLKKAEMFN